MGTLLTRNNLLARNKGQESQEAGTFNRLCQAALVERTEMCIATV